MVQAIINIDDNANRILNIVKAKFSLKDKSEAINVITQQYEQEILEPALRPEYVQKIKTLEKKGKFTDYKNISALRREIERT